MPLTSKAPQKLHSQLVLVPQLTALFCNISAKTNQPFLLSLEKACHWNHSPMAQNFCNVFGSNVFS
ncbi:hypothetical protein F2Q69_00047454 [Brassica cretica]|uniref:Uncharacterized protein n=2 Tax=Brassica cretica TaxID=69181 RepID=A0A8S9PTD9_BRACR|nr:hypothetical protein DY000_02059981 [Brassica cretica]KAF3525245.1 hypothetical protein F2Q69_00047454 [Brassica cretica]